MIERPVRAFAEGGMHDLLLRAMTDDYSPVDIGLPSLNRLLGGFNSFRGIGLGNLVVLGGAPKSMKTTIALNWMRRASQTPIITPVMLSYEMKLTELRYRMAMGYFGIAPDKFVPQRMTAEELVKMNRHYEENPPNFDPEFIRMHDPSLDVFMDQLEALREGGYNWFVFDNIQKLSVPGVSETNWEGKVRTIMFALEDWVMDEERPPVTVIALSQINRSASANRYESPTKHDLLGGTAIESQATQIFMLDHARQEYDREDNETRTFLLVEGNRDGPQFEDIPIAFQWSKMDLRQGMQDEEMLWPKHRKRVDG